MRVRFGEAGVIVLGVVGLAATLLGTLAVITRYAVSMPMTFSDEVVTYLIVWALLIGIALGERDGSHISATILLDRFGPRARRLTLIAVDVLTLAFLALLVVYGSQIAWQRFALGEVSPTVLQFPQWLARACVPVGLGLAAFAVAWRLARRLRGPDAS